MYIIYYRRANEIYIPKSCSIWTVCLVNDIRQTKRSLCRERVSKTPSEIVRK